ncbi:hypothetical protein BKA56DRAFT_571864 [Ilyonectria sp. MPI-CAGE-AT-0026]|nr:hypothetical protein BKA56DRAFT_571864 [Ilyonectria sp. MPI-CAGE-AT-0026]
MRESPALLGVFLFCGEWIEVGGDKENCRDATGGWMLHFTSSQTSPACEARAGGAGAAKSRWSSVNHLGFPWSRCYKSCPVLRWILCCPSSRKC